MADLRDDFPSLLHHPLTGEAILLEPGRVYNIDSPRFSYDGSRWVSEPIIQHGSIKIITVRDGFVGVTYDDGVLSVLQPGRHVLRKPSHVVCGFLSTGQQVLQLKQVTSMTSDSVGIVFDAAISIRVVNPALAITTLCGGGDSSSGESGSSASGSTARNRNVTKRRGGDNSGQQDESDGSSPPPVLFASEQLFETIRRKATLTLGQIIGNNTMGDTQVRRPMLRNARQRLLRPPPHPPHPHAHAHTRAHIHNLSRLRSAPRPACAAASCRTRVRPRCCTRSARTSSCPLSPWRR